MWVSYKDYLGLALLESHLVKCTHNIIWYPDYLNHRKIFAAMKSIAIEILDMKPIHIKYLAHLDFVTGISLQTTTLQSQNLNIIFNKRNKILYILYRLQSLFPACKPLELYFSLISYSCRAQRCLQSIHLTSLYNPNCQEPCTYIVLQKLNLHFTLSFPIA